MSISQEIRSATNDLHEEVEKTLFENHELIQRDEYLVFLRSQYLFQKLLEEALDDTEFCRKSDWRIVNRKKSEKIRVDLWKMNETVDFIEKSNPFISWQEPKLLGAAYVSEGSTLGGRFILNNILSRGNFELNGSRSFLQGYGSATGVAWKGFQRLLEEESKGREKEIIQGAREAFEIFREKIEQVR